jgi:hypothetical protein
MTEQQPTSKAVARFGEFVRQRRALLPRKERSDWQEVYAIASLRQVLEQVGLEMAAGIAHDADEVRALLNLAGATVEAKRAQKARPRFRGIGR